MAIGIGTGVLSMMNPDGTKTVLGNVHEVEIDFGKKADPKKVKSISKGKRRVRRSKHEDLIYTKSDLAEEVEKATKVAEILSRPVVHSEYMGGVTFSKHPSGLLTAQGAGASLVREKLVAKGLYGVLDRFHFETIYYQPRTREYILEFLCHYVGDSYSVINHHVNQEEIDHRYSGRVQNHDRQVIDVPMLIGVIRGNACDGLIRQHGWINLLNAAQEGLYYMRERNAPNYIVATADNFYTALLETANDDVGRF